MSTSAVRKKVKSSRHRSENCPWGFSPSGFSNRLHQKLVREVKAGRLPSSALRVTMTLGKPAPQGTKQPRPHPRAVGGPTMVKLNAGLSRLLGLFGRRSGTRGTE